MFLFTTQIIFYNRIARSVVNPDFTLDDVTGYNGSRHFFANEYLRTVGHEITSANNHRTSICPDGIASFAVPIPLHENTVGKSRRSLSVDNGILIARPPKGAIGEGYITLVTGAHDHHRRIFAIHCNKLAIRNQQSHRSAVFNQRRRMAGVGADSQKIAVTNAFFTAAKLITDPVSVTKRIKHSAHISTLKTEAGGSFEKLISTCHI